MSQNVMQGKRGLIMGVANKNSIAWGIAQACADAGAERVERRDQRRRGGRSVGAADIPHQRARRCRERGGQIDGVARADHRRRGQLDGGGRVGAERGRHHPHVGLGGGAGAGDGA